MNPIVLVFIVFTTGTVIVIAVLAYGFVVILEKFFTRMKDNMKRFEVQVILERTYATVEVEAENVVQARNIVRNLEAKDFDSSAVDAEMDILYVDEI